jgi:hypothetical protein
MNNNCNNNWFCHNICNYTKHDQWNNDIFKRVLPEYKRELVLDIRPDIKLCNNKNPKNSIEYRKFDQKNLPINLERNLEPNSLDKDSKFCYNKICLGSDIGKPYSLEYLKNIDIDSYLKLMTNKLSKCDNTKKNPYICSDILDSHTTLNDFSPQLVNINRVNGSTKFACLKSDNLDTNKNIENLFNNNTKAVYREKQKYLNSR